MPILENTIIRSEGFRDFISHRPSFIVRWGTVIFFIILVILGIGSYFIRYPDIIRAKAKVNSVNPPKQVSAKSNGRILKLFKGDGWDVKKGDVIGYMESIASHEEVILLAKDLDTLQMFTDSSSLEKIPQFWQSSGSTFSHLGELQQSHEVFMQAYISFRDYLNTGFYVKKKSIIQLDLDNTKRLLRTLYQQKEIQNQDLALTQKNFEVHDTLHQEALLSELDFRNQKSLLLSKRMGIPQMNALIISNENQQNALQKEILELDNQIVQQKALFVQALNSYRSAVEEWKQKYLLISPVNGTFVYAGFWDENQQVQTGQIIGFITSKTNKYFVELQIPQTNFGKVKRGQKVLLKFPSYPYLEFGSVLGRIEEIKNIPSDSGYLAKVTLPMGLVTNYGKTLLFTEGLLAQAEIISDEKRLTERFMGQFSGLIK